jgi:preprotein translocase subunit SecB
MNEAQFTVQRVYIKDCSFESPLSPKVFIGEWKPTYKVEMSNSYKKIDSENAEVVLTIEITAEQEGEVAFLVEVQQAGTFSIKNLSDFQAEESVNVWAPTTLFPYVREAIDSLVTKGGFPDVSLQPVNFEVLYRQKKASEQEKASESKEAP